MCVHGSIDVYIRVWKVEVYTELIALQLTFFLNRIFHWTWILPIQKDEKTVKSEHSSSFMLMVLGLLPYHYA